MRALLRIFVSLFPVGLAVAICSSLATEPAWGADSAAAVEARLLGDVSFLAADSLEGRGIQTPGIRKAADYIRAKFEQAGLQPGAGEGGYFQPFIVQIDFELEPAKTSLALRGPDEEAVTLELGKDYSPIAHGGDGDFDAPIVFAGYGITAEDEKYDDYAGIDVAGKVVLVIRREPQQGDEHSVFNGKRESQHAGMATKIQNAWVHKAAAVLLVSDPFTVKSDADDKLLPANYLGFNSTVGVPVAHISRKFADRLLAGTDLESVAKVEAAIDADLKPRSREIPRWRATGAFTFNRVNADLVNVIGTLEGQGPHADETIVIGAHYDHLGFGGEGSLAPNSREIHNGADDNASGTAALIELARRFAARPEKPARRLVFIAFSAEERGLLGSRHYVKKAPVYSLDSTVAMFNFDMVGRMKNDRLIVYGTKTASEFEAMVDRLGEPSGLKLKKIPGGGGASDHASFYNAKIPAFHFFTGTHTDYHRPSDDVDKINAEGMRRVVDFAEQLVDAVLALDDRPEFAKAAEEDPHAGLDLPASGGTKAYLGTVPDYGEEVEGVLLNDIKAGSPAETAGLKPGDVIVDIDGMPIKNVQQFTVALYKHKPGDQIVVTVQRGADKVTATATLGAR